MLARYYSNSLGRFMSPDPLSPILRQDEDPVEFGALITNPQVWNRYTYVRNNPIHYRDPSGKFAQAAVIYFVPGVGEVAAGVTIGVLAGAAIYEGVDLYINYSRNKELFKGIEGLYYAGLDNLARHPQMDPNDPKWRKAIEEMKRIIRELRDKAAKLTNKAKKAAAEELARDLEKGLDEATILNAGTTTEPKGDFKRDSGFLPDKPHVEVHCSCDKCC